ncbi:MAG: hypothetical protein NZ775_03135 [Gammaproteobacteria bacterium]|nr:hypothetical protein [Gammaproteobacteria bacterium]
MIRFGISWVARLLGVSGFTIQQRTSSGSLQALNIAARAIPSNPSNLAFKNPYSEPAYHLNRMQKARIKTGEVVQQPSASNDEDFVSVIATLKSKLYKETQANQHYIKVFNELNVRLEELEQAVQPEKQQDLQKLQGWVHSKRVLH